jgi:hypothetical protein
MKIWIVMAATGEDDDCIRSYAFDLAAAAVLTSCIRRNALKQPNAEKM